MTEDEIHALEKRALTGDRQAVVELVSMERELRAQLAAVRAAVASMRLASREYMSDVRAEEALHWADRLEAALGGGDAGDS